MKLINILIALIIVLFTIAVAFCFIADGKEIPITFQWDSNSTEGEWKSVKIFAKFNNGEYDYTTSLLSVPQAYENGLSLPIEAKTNLHIPDNEKTTVYFVAKSYDNEDNFSEDSNELILTYDLVPLVLDNSNIVFDKDTSSINFSWKVLDNRITSYKILKSLTIDGEFEVLENLNIEEGKIDYEKKIPIEELFPENEETTIYFKIMAFGPNYATSSNVEPIPITINRIVQVDKIINFKLILE